MNVSRNIIVQSKPLPRFADREIEICEHKGVGHPDTITDGACEAAACALAAAYERLFGDVLHFNVDKGLLVAGQSEPRFGGGRILEPIRLVVCGRATSYANKLDVHDTVTTAVREFLMRNHGTSIDNFRVETAIKDGSANLDSVYASQKGKRIANDTSIGVGFAPYSFLEQQVLRLSSTLRSADFLRSFPAAGNDFKIMGLRTCESLRITLAIALIDRHIEYAAHYFETKHAMQAYLRETLPARCDLQINALDDPGARDESGLYLTVTGLSAEMGDDGQVGRGNRVNGLITPNRPMSLEAAAGKNPVAHVGKIYNVLAHAMATLLVNQIDEIDEADVQLVSTIGAPIDQPQVALVEIGTAGQLTASVRDRAISIVNEQLEDIEALTHKLVRGHFAVF